MLTGFLGAGKTTLLNRLLKDETLSHTAVIINEFGDVALDHLLVEYIGDNMVLLQSGCLCCTMRGDLVDALETLLRDLDNQRCTFRRVLLETTGLADPAPVLHTAMAHPYLVQRYRLDGVVTVVDCVNGEATLDAHAEAIKQAAVADRIVLTKTDLATAKQRSRIVERLRALNPAAPILDAAKGEATAERLMNCGLYDPAAQNPRRQEMARRRSLCRRAARTHASPSSRRQSPRRAHPLIRAHRRCRHSGRHARHVSRTIARDPRDKLLRLKGIVKLAEMPDTPVVVHGVQHVFHPTARLERWPDDDHRTRLVFITRDLSEAAVRELFGAFLGAASVDRPDRAALTDNPLVPFGGADR